MGSNYEMFVKEKRRVSELEFNCSEELVIRHGSGSGHHAHVCVCACVYVFFLYPTHYKYRCGVNRALNL